jgi:hypothetical protein
MDGCSTSRGLAGGSTKPDVIHGWKQNIEAPTKNTSSLHLLAKVG